MIHLPFPAARWFPGQVGFVLFLLAQLAGPAHAAKPPPASALAPAPAPPHVSPSYYYTIDLDPHYQFVGTGALTEEDAKRANCYRFVYDRDDRLTQIEYRRAGTPMQDPFLGVARVDFEYQPGIERRWFRDAQGQPARDLDGIQGEELTLNAAGYPTAVTNLDAAGNHVRDNSGVIRYERTLDEHGRLIASRRLGLFGTPITDDNGYFERRTSYDDQGHILEQGNYDAHGRPLNDTEGIAQTRTTYTFFPDATQLTESYFDASGLAAEERRTGIHQRQITTDRRGLVTDEAYFDATGAPATTGDDRVHERKYTYDDLGNLVTEEFFDINGRPVNARGLEIAKIVYRYDDKNRVHEKAYFGDDGAPQISPEVGAAMIRQEYDAKGTLVRRLFLDGQGHPSPHVQYGVPAIRINVDGDTTTVFLRNENDRPTKNPIGGYYAFSYHTETDRPLSLTNKYYDRHGRAMSLLRVRVINPHLHALAGDPAMQWSARLGAGGAGLGALLACWLALKKSSFTRRRKVYIPSPLERFLGWFAIFAILEGILRFFMTVYWAWVDYRNGRMGIGFNVVETVFILFFLYRLYRMSVTMRVLNIDREDIHRLLRDFFLKAGLKPEWVDGRRRYITPPLDVRLDYFRQKFHAYLAFTSRGAKGAELARNLAAYLRAQTGGMLAPERTRGIAFYYPCVAIGYLLLAGLAFYTLFQLIKGY
ncbi:MAG: hypothetical protein WDO13_17125 [Verrucomicrobiota bacterium]